MLKKKKVKHLASSDPALPFAKHKSTGRYHTEHDDIAKVESDLHVECEQILRDNGFVLPGDIASDDGELRKPVGIYFHVPNEAFNGKESVRNLENLPDFIVLRYDGQSFLPELKSKQGKLMRGQKSLGKIMPIQEFKSAKHFEEELKVFINATVSFDWKTAQEEEG